MTVILFDDDTISPSVLNATELSETTVVGSPLASSTQENPDDLASWMIWITLLSHHPLLYH